MIKKVKLQNELFLLGVLVIICGVFTSINPNFLSVTNFLNITKNSIEIGIYAIGVLLILISGGIDISFMAVSVFSMYATVKFSLLINPDMHILFIFLISGIIGSTLGLINGYIISKFNLPAFIVTLGTSKIFVGILQAYIGAKQIGSRDLPIGMKSYSSLNLFEYVSDNGIVYGLHSATLILIVILVLAWYVLKYTQFGRNIYAIGGDRISAKRVGINIMKTNLIAFALVGALAGVTGIIHSSFVMLASPFDLIDKELNVIAAVVLGGASIFGGKGTVLGTLIGVVIIVIINSSLILLGIPSFWQKVVVGVIIIVSVSLQALRERNRRD
ncbi:ABC transporter permease [Mycoplasmatota bacterium zrk1]